LGDSFEKALFSANQFLLNGLKNFTKPNKDFSLWQCTLAVVENKVTISW
jgi:hypothetical protein